MMMMMMVRIFWR